MSGVFTMADSDSDDILSADFLEPGELLDSDDERPDANDCSSARTSQSMPSNRPKVRFSRSLKHFRNSVVEVLACSSRTCVFVVF